MSAIHGRARLRPRRIVLAAAVRVPGVGVYERKEKKNTQRPFVRIRARTPYRRDKISSGKVSFRRYFFYFFFPSRISPN